MKEYSLSGSLRTETGKKGNKQLRRNEEIPAVIYGGEKNVNISVSERDLKNLIYTPDVFLVNLSVDKQNFKAIVKDIQFHPVTDKVLHLDFLQVFDNKPVTVALPVKLTGSAEGVRQGGRLSWITRRLRVHGFIKNFPDAINVDISNLVIGKSRLVSDLTSTDFEIVNPKSTVIAIVKTARAAKIAEGDDLDEEGAEEGAEGAAEGEGAPAETAAE